MTAFVLIVVTNAVKPADAIVNSANPKPKFGSGVDAAIYRAAGEKRLLAEREKIGEMEPGEVAVTPAFDRMY